MIDQRANSRTTATPHDRRAHSRTHSRPMMRRLGSVYSKDAMNESEQQRSIRALPQVQGCLKVGVIVRLKLESNFEHLGDSVSKSSFIQHAIFVLLILLTIVFGSGLGQARMETNIEKLWVEAGGRLQRESEYIKKWRGSGQVTATATATSCSASESQQQRRRTDSSDEEIAGFSNETSAGFGSFEIIIVTPIDKATDVISSAVLTDKLKMMIDITYERNVGDLVG